MLIYNDLISGSSLCMIDVVIKCLNNIEKKLKHFKTNLQYW